MRKILYSLVALYLIIVVVYPVVGDLWSAYGGGQMSIPANLISANADQFSRQFISLLINGNIDEAYSYLPAQTQTIQAKSALQQMALLDFSSTTISDLKVVGAYTNYYSLNGVGQNVHEMIYVLTNNNPDRIKYQLIDVQSADMASGTQLLNFQVQPMDSFPLKFSYTAGNIILLILSVIIPVFIAYTAFRYTKKSTKPNILVVLGVLLIVVYFTISSDHYAISVGFHSFIVRANAWTPWAFNTPLPLGALIYYIFRKRLEKQA